MSHETDHETNQDANQEPNLEPGAAASEGLTAEIAPHPVQAIGRLSATNQLIAHAPAPPGPVFTDLLLVDEINRMPPRTQAALLECMEERQVTTDGVRRPLPAWFTVFATQNPVDFEGTYP